MSVQSQVSSSKPRQLAEKHISRPAWLKALALAALVAALIVLGRRAGGVLPAVAEQVSRMGAWDPVAYVVGPPC